MKENDPLAIATLCLVVALFAAVAEVKILREQVKRLEERETVIIHKVDNAGVTMVGKVTGKDVVDGHYYVEVKPYGKFLVTREQYDEIEIGQDIPEFLKGRGN
ncbi:TPA: DUF1372 family protein [Streptococcus suis]